jgi:hypothetical protein
MNKGHAARRKINHLKSSKEIVIKKTYYGFEIYLHKISHENRKALGVRPCIYKYSTEFGETFCNCVVQCVIT